MIDLNKLEELARAATGGPWVSDAGSSELCDQNNQSLIRSYSDPAWFSKEEDAVYAAAANPATMLDLIALIRKQEVELAEARAESANSGTFPDAAVTVDTPVFAALLGNFIYAQHATLTSASKEVFSKAESAEKALIAHIDAHASQASNAAFRSGMDQAQLLWDAERESKDDLIARLRRQIDTAAEKIMEPQMLPAQPGDGELPALPPPSPTHYRERGMLLERMEMFTADQMRAYGRQCRAAGIEEAAKLIDDPSMKWSARAHWAVEIRALNKTGGA